MVNKLSPKKLLHSKWTAVSPKHKEKHFMVIEVEVDEDDVVLGCVIEAIISKRQLTIKWRELKSTDHWLQGWR